MSEHGELVLITLGSDREFDTSLEHNPPVPTLQPGPNPLYTFLGFTPGKHLLSMSARDPYDGREMPANSVNHVSVYSLRGVRKVRYLFFC